MMREILMYLFCGKSTKKFLGKCAWYGRGRMGHIKKSAWRIVPGLIDLAYIIVLFAYETDAEDTAHFTWGKSAYVHTGY